MSHTETSRVRRGNRLQKAIVETSLRGITKIEPLIHRSIFFSNEYGYDEIQKGLGKIRVLSPQESKKYLKREPGYRTVGYIQRE
jgi:hypothetical protein